MLSVVHTSLHRHIVACFRLFAFWFFVELCVEDHLAKRNTRIDEFKILDGESMSLWHKCSD